VIVKVTEANRGRVAFNDQDPKSAH